MTEPTPPSAQSMSSEGPRLLVWLFAATWIGLAAWCFSEAVSVQMAGLRVERSMTWLTEAESLRQALLDVNAKAGKDGPGEVMALPDALASSLETPRLLHEAPAEGWARKEALESWSTSAGEYRRAWDQLERAGFDDDRAAGTLARNGAELAGAMRAAESAVRAGIWEVAANLSGYWAMLYLLGAACLGFAGVAAGMAVRLRNRSHQLILAERAASAQKQRFEALIQTSRDLIFCLDQELRWTFVSDASKSLYGYEPAELTGKEFLNITLAQKRRSVRLKLTSVLEHGKALSFETVHVTREGMRMRMRLAVAPLLDADGKVTAVTGTASNLTLLHEERDRIAQIQRMKAMSKLSAGIAHEFNDLLTAVMGNADLALLDAEEPDICREHLREIMRAVIRARDLAEQLRAFGGRQPAQKVETNLVDVIRKVQALLGKVLPEDIELHVKVPDETVAVTVDPAQISQALVTLAVKARESIGSGMGFVSLSLTQRRVPPQEAMQFGLGEGQWAVMEMTDSGSGLDSESLDRIFEPFSAGPNRKGSGLELATVHGIVQRHGGAIVARSGTDHGTTFTVFLPAIDLEDDEVFEETPAALTRVSAPEIRRVAVVEDQAIVRNTLVGILKAFDIDVLVPETATEALSILATETPRVDALITDVRMPDMSGPELASALRAIHPDLPVLFISGYTDVTFDEVWDDAHAVGFLPKPFTPNQLFAALRALMILPRHGRSRADPRALARTGFRRK